MDRSEALKNAYDKTAPFYDMQYKDFQLPKYQEALALIPAVIKNMDKVLDHGCGTGMFFEYLKKKDNLPHELVGLDYSPGMLSIAASKGVTAVEGRIEELPFDNEMFDAVFSFTVLRIIPQDEALVLKEMHRVLKPGGYCVLSLMIDADEESLEVLLQQLGFKTLSFEYVGQDMMFVARKN